MDAEENRSNRIIFVHSDLALYGLSPYEFRLYADIARRGKCFSNLNTTAKICKMSVRKAQYALKTLENLGLVEKTIRKGKTDIYELTPRSKWKDPDEDEDLQPEREKVAASLLRLKGSTNSPADSKLSKYKQKLEMNSI